MNGNIRGTVNFRIVKNLEVPDKNASRRGKRKWRDLFRAVDALPYNEFKAFEFANPEDAKRAWPNLRKHYANVKSEDIERRTDPRYERILWLRKKRHYTRHSEHHSRKSHNGRRGRMGKAKSKVPVPEHALEYE